MSTIHFEPLSAHAIEELCIWHKDPELAGRIGGNDWPNKLWTILQKDSLRSCWLAYIDHNLVGYVDFEEHPDENIAWIGLAVKPDRRNQGFGKHILQNFLQLPIVKAWPKIRAGIEVDNIASKKCFMSLGFKPMQEKADDEGIIDFSFNYNK